MLSFRLLNRKEMSLTAYSWLLSPRLFLSISPIESLGIFSAKHPDSHESLECVTVVECILYDLISTKIRHIKLHSTYSRGSHVCSKTIMKSKGMVVTKFRVTLTDAGSWGRRWDRRLSSEASKGLSLQLGDETLGILAVNKISTLVQHLFWTSGAESGFWREFLNVL